MSRKRDKTQETKETNAAATDPASDQTKVNQQPADPAPPNPPEQTKQPTDPPKVDPPADPPAEKQAQPVALPSVGRIVHFHLSNNDVRPAIIVNVQDVKTVDLQVFTNGQADRPHFNERSVHVNVKTGADHHAVPSVVHRAGVVLGTAAGQWSWPARS